MSPILATLVDGQAGTGVSVIDLENLIISIAVPYGATLLMMGIESLVETVGWQMRLVRAGWDMCVLGLGAGGIFAAPAMVKGLGERAVILALASTALSLACGIGVMHVRKGAKEHATGWRALISVALGSVAVGLPVYFAMHSGG